MRSELIKWYDGKTYKRVSKSVARKAYYEDSKGLLIAPCLLNMESKWSSGITMPISLSLNFGVIFERTSYYYEMYNCNSELGKYAKYFVEIGG